jgi:hypothetical protein
MRLASSLACCVAASVSAIPRSRFSSPARIGFHANFVSRKRSSRNTANDQSARSVWNQAGLSKSFWLTPWGGLWPISGPWPACP